MCTCYTRSHIYIFIIYIHNHVHKLTHVQRYEFHALLWCKGNLQAEKAKMIVYVSVILQDLVSDTCNDCQH